MKVAGKLLWGEGDRGFNRFLACSTNRGILASDYRRDVRMRAADDRLSHVSCASRSATSRPASGAAIGPCRRRSIAC
jgi:hypothetical protein